MDFIKYYVRVVRVALTHSLHAAHSIVLILLILAGVITWLDPRIEILVDLHGWEPLALIAAGIVAVRLILAPFWIWKDDQTELADLRRQLASNELSDQQLAARTAAIDEIAEEISWAVNNLVNPKPHPASTGDLKSAIAAFEAKLNAWYDRVSKKLENRDVFTLGEQKHFDFLGFIQPVTVWGAAHPKLDHLFSQNWIISSAN
jgi:hypothetical protein